MKKVCFKCKTMLPVSSFYKHPAMTGGRVNKCKECTKLGVRTNRKANVDYYTAYEKSRANNPNRVQARYDYSQTEIGKRNAQKAKDKWDKNNVIKKAAHTLVGNAVRDKRLIKPKECSVCHKTGRIEGHHDNYAYPMLVKWFCSKCHKLWHRENEVLL